MRLNDFENKCDPTMNNLTDNWEVKRGNDFGH